MSEFGPITIKDLHFNAAPIEEPGGAEGENSNEEASAQDRRHVNERIEIASRSVNDQDLITEQVNQITQEFTPELQHELNLGIKAKHTDRILAFALCNLAGPAILTRFNTFNNLESDYTVDRLAA